MVTELDPVDVPDALRTRALDVALIHDYDYVPTEPDPALDNEPLREETVYLAAAGHPADPAEDVISACRDATWIVGSPETMCHTMVIRACQAARFTPRIRHHADDFATVLALVAAGQGVALIPQLAATDVPAGVTLTPLQTRRRTRIAYRSGTRRHPAVSAFAAAIHESATIHAGRVPQVGAEHTHAVTEANCR
jgi:DNA-binding transcriptional LysR family regulator